MAIKRTGPALPEIAVVVQIQGQGADIKVENPGAIVQKK